MPIDRPSKTNMAGQILKGAYFYVISWVEEKWMVNDLKACFKILVNHLAPN